MKHSERFGMAWHNLAVRKLRTALNLVGIVVSCVLLLCTLAATTGVQVALEEFVKQSDSALRIRLMPDYDRNVKIPDDVTRVEGEMTERRRNRIQKALAGKWRDDHLTRRFFIPSEQLDLLRKIDGVLDVCPTMRVSCGLVTDDRPLDSGDNNRRVGGVSYLDQSVAARVISGVNLTSDEPHGILIHEFLAYELGYRADQALNDLIDQTVVLQFRPQPRFSFFDQNFFQLEFDLQSRLMIAINQIMEQGVDSLDEETRKLIQDFAERRSSQSRQKTTDSKANIADADTLIERKCRVVGVFRYRDEEDPIRFLANYFGSNPPLLMHYSQLDEYFAAEQRGGYQSAEAFIRDIRDLDRITDQIRELGISPVSVARPIQQIRQGIDQAKYTVMAIVAIVLLISAIGITNTMIMSLVERTEEIGIMKAVGGSNRTVMWMILYEGALTGLLGGLLSVGIAFLVSFFGNWALLSYVEYRTRIQLDAQLFTIEFWMIGLTMIVSVLITTLSGIWPAYRASRMDPVVAMSQ